MSKFILSCVCAAFRKMPLFDDCCGAFKLLPQCLTQSTEWESQKVTRNQLGAAHDLSGGPMPSAANNAIFMDNRGSRASSSHSKMLHIAGPTARALSVFKVNKRLNGYGHGDMKRCLLKKSLNFLTCVFNCDFRARQYSYIRLPFRCTWYTKLCSEDEAIRI